MLRRSLNTDRLRNRDSRRDEICLIFEMKSENVGARSASNLLLDGLSDVLRGARRGWKCHEAIVIATIGASGQKMRRDRHEDNN